MNSGRIRFLKAYGTVLAVLGSYLGYALKKRILGEAWALSQINLVHQKNARRIEETILDLKGIFIKVGQMLSIMSNFLADELRSGLEGLQDAVPPHPYPAIEERFLQEFGKKPAELFTRFDPDPIASASLGQVHVAYLKDGTKVAVKVQYPRIEEIVRIDLKTLKRIFSLLHLFFPLYGLKRVYEEIAEVIGQELDYRYEAKNLEELRGNFKGDKGFKFPDVFPDYSSSRILTLRFMEGIKISSLRAGQGIHPREVATRIIHAYCKQIFLDGVYHADPHPGNLLIQEDGKIVLVDFGALARVSVQMREGMARFAEGLIKRDTRVIALSMREMGFVAREEGMESYEKLIDYFYGKLTHLKIDNFKELNLGKIQNLGDFIELKKMRVSFRDLMTSFHVPKDWVLLERTMLLVVGLCSHLDPTLNPMEIVLPYLEKFVLKDRSFAEVAITLTKEIGLSYLQLPQEIHKVLKRLHEGKLVVTHPEVRRQTERLYLLGHQSLYAFLGLGGVFLALRLQEVGFEAVSRYAYAGSALFGGILLISFIKNRRG